MADLDETLEAILDFCKSQTERDEEVLKYIEALQANMALKTDLIEKLLSSKTVKCPNCTMEFPLNQRHMPPIYCNKIGLG